MKCENVQKEQVPSRLSKCELHTDKEDDMVCCDHDVVCCRVCITKDHRSCQNIDYLPDLARTFKDDGERVELDRDLNERIKEITRVLNDYTTHAFKLKTRKATCLKRLEIFQTSIADFVKTVVNKAEKDIEKQFGPDIRSMQDHIRRYNELLSKLNCLSKDLSFENVDVAEFKKVLECKRTLKEIRIESFACDDKFSMDEFQNTMVESVVNHFTDDKLIGSLKIVGFGTFDIPNLYVKENHSSTIVLLADFHNDKIRHIKTDLTETDSFDVEGHIWGICEVDKQDIAFTLTELRKVQFLSTDQNQVLKSSFPTNARCRGIAYLNEKIYVTCVGIIGEEEKEGQVNVFDMKGNLLDKYTGDLEGKYFSIPRSILVNTEGIYITDQQNGIICLDLEGKRKWVCNNSKCKFPFGICFTKNGNLLASGRDSNNIVIVGKDGKFQGELLNKNDGLSEPIALGIDKRNNCIIVSELNTPCLKMFYIGDCEI